jgi:hypothetical protein
MTPINATIQNVDRRGGEHFITVLVERGIYLGSFDKLHFESSPDLGWYDDGRLDLVYHRDLGFKAGDPFPLWVI